jgi:hypothetical protein
MNMILRRFGKKKNYTRAYFARIIFYEECRRTLSASPKLSQRVVHEFSKFDHGCDIVFSITLVLRRVGSVGGDPLSISPKPSQRVVLEFNQFEVQI